MMLAAAALVLALVGEDMSSAAAGMIEGRPPEAERSVLQARIDAARARARIEIGPGDYAGDLFLDFGAHRAVDGLSLAVERGEQVARCPSVPTPMSSHLLAHADAASRDADPAAQACTDAPPFDIFGLAGPPQGKEAR